MSRSGAPPPLKRHFCYVFRAPEPRCSLTRRERQFSRYEYRPVCQTTVHWVTYLPSPVRISAVRNRAVVNHVIHVFCRRSRSRFRRFRVAPPVVHTKLRILTSRGQYSHCTSSPARFTYAVRFCRVPTCSRAFPFTRRFLRLCAPHLRRVATEVLVRFEHRYFVTRPTIAVRFEFRSPKHPRVFPSARPTSCERVSRDVF